MSVTRVQLVGNVSTGASFSGIVTATSAVVGSAVTLNASGIRVVGVVTATSAIIGTGVTLNASGVSVTGIVTATSAVVGSAVTLNASGVSVTGVISATSFVGSGSGLTGVGIGTNGNVNTTGIITANQFSGSGDNLIFSPTITSFSPTDGATGVALDTNIVLTFNQLIYAGVGSIFLRNSSGIGTIIEAIGIGSTSCITISNQTLTINPTSNFPSLTNIYVVLPQGVITNSIGGGIASLSTYDFTSIDFSLSSIAPSNGATNVGVGTTITLTFTSPPTRGTGTVVLRSGSAGGSTIESFNAASSARISVVGNTWNLTPTSALAPSTSIYTVIPSTAITSYAGLNTTGASSHSFTTRAAVLGDSYEGGYLICRAGSLNWIVAPASAEVYSNWYNRSGAITCAQSVSGCTGWFVPTRTQLQNPGFTCRTYWDSYSATRYWSDTEGNNFFAWNVSMVTGSFIVSGYLNCAQKTYAYPVRAFRCVTY